MSKSIQIGDIARITHNNSFTDYNITEINRYNNNIIIVIVNTNNESSSKTLIIDKDGYHIRGENDNVVLTFLEKISSTESSVENIPINTENIPINTENIQKTGGDSNIDTYPFSISTEIYHINGKTEIPEWILNASGNFKYHMRTLYNHQPFRESLESFSNNIFGVNLIDYEKLNELYHDNKSYFNDLEALANEQSHYLNIVFKDPFGISIPNIVDADCDTYVIATKLNDEPYGAIFAFKNNNNSTDIMIQGISKFVPAGTFQLLRPEESKTLPRLNSILMPKVEELARELGVKRITVAPFDQQGEILQKYYGFYPIDSKDYTCDKITKSWGSTQHFAKNVSPMIKSARKQ